jgi:hypothetical protein
MIPIISHISICKQLACPHKISQLRHRLLWIIPFGSIEVTPEYASTLKKLRLARKYGNRKYTRISGGAEQYHGVRERLEAR